MANDRIGPCGNYLLPFFNLNDTGSKAVLPESQENHPIPEEYNNISEDDNRQRNIRPAEAKIKTRYQKTKDKWNP